MAVTVDIRTLPSLTAACLRQADPLKDVELEPALRSVLAQARVHGLLGPATRPVRLCPAASAAVPLEKWRCDIGVTVDREPAADGPLVPRSVPGGPFAVGLHRGAYRHLEEVRRWLIEEWLPDSGYAYRAGPSVEVYLNGPEHTPEPERLTEVRIPVRPRR